MAMTTTRINGTCSLGRGYSFYANVLVWDTINSGNTFTVMVNTYLVNGGTRTNSSNWTKNITIANVGEETLTGQSVNTTTVDRNGGEILIQSKSFQVPITLSSISVSAYASKSSYTQYDPGYCSVSGNVSMPKVASTWNSSLLSIANVENAFTLPINKYVSSYYNVVEVRNNNNSTLVKTINDAVDGTKVTFTTSELNTIFTMDNNANQLPLRFFLDLKTYTSSAKTTQIGATQRLTCEAYIVDGEPTATYTIVEQDSKVISLLGGSTTNKIIKNASDLLFTITPTALKGATISSVKINDSPATKSGNNYVLNITNISTGTFNIVITDSRGLSTPYTATKTVVDYLALKYNNWTIKRQSQTSSNLVLNADITCYSSSINGSTNTPVVKYSIDGTNWTTISSSSYTFTNNKITITNLTLNNLINYQTSGTFYIKVTDLLGEINDNKNVAVGIYTFAKSDRKVRINGTLEIADRNGQNRAEIRDLIKGYNLYNSSSGATNNITLSDNPSNYRYIDIYYGKSSNDLKVTRFWDITNGNLKTLYSVDAFSNNSMQQLYKHIQFNISSNNYTITSDYGFYINTTVGTDTISFQPENNVKIYKVIGYK